jgi:hypothetical protein
MNYTNVGRNLLSYLNNDQITFDQLSCVTFALLPVPDYDSIRRYEVFETFPDSLILHALMKCHEANCQNNNDQHDAQI